jgi:2-polyprenyl-3-methyl-5-hydroxy-6-metoxy-1,4-benzoquinol methylase
MVNEVFGESGELRRLARLGWDAEDVGSTTVDRVHFIGNPIEIDYPHAGLAALGLEGGAGYWFDHRAQSVIDALEHLTRARSIWDIGAGAGSMSGRLLRAGYDVVAVEPIAEGARAIARQGIPAVFCSSLEQLGLPGGCLHVVGLFDVIEHIENPTDLLREVHRVLDPSGVAVLTVPAFPVLWSDEDEVAGHKLRYRRNNLDRLMSSLGFHVMLSQYLFGSLVVPVVLKRAMPFRLGRRLKQDEALAAVAQQLSPGPRLDRAMRRLLRVEHTVGKRFRMPVGTSVMGLYRRI